MKRTFAKLLCAMLAVLIIAASLPFAALAETIPESYYTISLDTVYGISLSETMKKYYGFIPEEDGIYRFASSGVYDTFVALYDEDMGALGSDDDGGDGGNFCLDIKLEKGNLYFIKVGGFESNAWFDFSVTKPELATELVITDKDARAFVSYTAHVGEKKRFLSELLPLDSTGEAIVWSIDDTSVATVDRYGNVKFNSVGEAVLKASSGEIFATIDLIVSEIQTIEPNSKTTIDLPATADHLCLKLEAEANSTYSFFYQNSYGETASVYDAEMNLVSEDTDADGLLSFVAEKTEIYLIKIDFKGADLGESTTVRLDQTVNASQVVIGYERNGLKFINKEYNFFTNDSVCLTYYTYPENAVGEMVSYWESSNPTVIDVDSYSGQLYFYSEGYADITLHTINGLTATVRINTQNPHDVSINQSYIAPLDNINCGIYFGRFYTGADSTHTLEYSFESPVDITISTLYGATLCELNSVTTGAEALELYTYYDLMINIKSTYADTLPINGTYNIKSILRPDSINIVDNGEEIYEYHCEVGDEFKLDYVISPEDAIIESVNWYADNTDVLSVAENGVITALKEGSTSLSVIAGNVSDNIWVYVDKFTDIELDGAYTAEYNEEINTVKFRYTPVETAYYKFIVSGEGANSTWINIKDSSDRYLDNWCDYSEGDVLTYTMKLTAGEEHIIYLHCNSFTTLSVTLGQYPKADKINFYYNEEITESILGYSGERIWISYDFANPECFVNMNVSLESSDNNIVTVKGQNLYLNNTGVAIITATADDGTVSTLTVEVAADTELTLNTPVSYTFENWYQGVRYKFVPAVDGYYTLNYGNKYYVNTYATDSTFNNLEEIWLHGLCYYKLNAGETYYFKAYSPEILDTYTFVLERAADVESITIKDEHNNSTEKINAFVGDVIKVNVATYPENSICEEIMLNSSNPDIVIAADNNLYFTGEGDAVITASAIVGDKEITDTLNVYVSATPAITLGTTVTVNADPNFNHKTFSFTPETSGWYGFASYGNYDIIGAIYDAGGIELAYDDDDGKNSNFLISLELEAGNTYYLFSRFFDEADNQYPEYNYDISIYNMVEATGVSITDNNGNDIEEINVYSSDKIFHLYYSFIPYNGLPEKLSWSSSNEDVIKPEYYSGDDNCRARIAGTGECIVTVRTESGLTDSVKITVLDTPTVYLDTPIKISLPEGSGVYQCVSFKPEKSGYYKLRSYNHNDEGWGRWFNVYDQNGNGISLNSNTNPEETVAYVYLNAGEEYQIELCKNYVPAVSYDFVITESVAISSMTILEMPTNPTVYENTYDYDLSGLKLSVTTTDGKTAVWEYGSSDTICGFEYITGYYTKIENDTLRTHITAGSCECIIPFTVIEHPVKDIEIITARDIVYIQNTNGWWEDGHYIYNEPADEIYVKINYKNGTTKFAPVYSYVDDIYISINSNQYDEPWNECGKYFFTVSMGNYYAEVPVSIVPSPIVNIELADKDFYVECMEGTKGFFTTDPYGNRYWRYDLYSFDTDLVISYDDGTSETVPMYQLDYHFNSDQEENTWGVGTHSFELVVEGYTIEIPFVITESDISKVELTKAPVLSYTYGSITDGNMNGNEFYPYLDLDDDFEFVIYYKDNTTETVTAADLDEWGMLYDADVYIASNDDPAVVGSNTAYLCWRNFELEFSYTVNPSPVASISVSNVPTNVTSTDFLPNFDGLTITVNNTDGSEETITITPDMLVKITRYARNYDYAYHYVYEDNTILIGYNYDNSFEVYYLGKTAAFDVENFEIFNIDNIEIVRISEDKSLYDLLITFVDGSEYELTIDTAYAYSDDGGFGGFGPEITEFLNFRGHGICDKGIYVYNIYAVSYINGLTEYSVDLIEGYAYETGESDNGLEKEVIGDLNGDGKMNVADLVYAKKLLANATEALVDTDFNGDDTFNAIDIIYMRKSIMDACILTDVYADVDGDGGVTITDALKIAVYLAGSNDILSSMADVNLDGVINDIDKNLILDTFEF